MVVAGIRGRTTGETNNYFSVATEPNTSASSTLRPLDKRLLMGGTVGHRCFVQDDRRGAAIRGLPFLLSVPEGIGNFDRKRLTWKNVGVDRDMTRDEERCRKEAERIAARSADRRHRMVVHRAHSFADAAEWDLRYWQSRTPAQRLEAFRALLQDVAVAQRSRRRDADSPGAEPS